MRLVAQCLHEYHLTDCPDNVLEAWREDAEEILLWQVDIHGFDADGMPRDLTGAEDPQLALALADCRALVVAQAIVVRRVIPTPRPGL